jgi:ATP-dependent DNA helicase RecG
MTDIAVLPVTALKGVGPKLKDKLARLGLFTVQDVLFHLPLRYQDRTRLTPIGSLRPGREALFAGTIDLADVVYRKRRSLVVRVSDGSGHVHLRFFYFSAQQQANLARGRRIRCFGEVRFGPSGYEIAHPEYTLLGDDEAAQAEARLTPVYPATEGVHHLTVRKLVTQALDSYLDAIPDYLPEETLEQARLVTLKQALDFVHRPPPGADLAVLADGRHPAQQRLAFEELLAHHLSLRRLRARLARERAPALTPRGELLTRLLASLPFRLTRAQQRVLAEVRADLAKNHPMQRLVQGDVGSGKTVVAAGAAVAAVEAGHQAAIMAPTELLSEQHLRNFVQWLEPLGLRVAGLSGKLNSRARGEALHAMASGQAQVIVGTHALFEGDAAFARLGLIVVDEQHRFGVHQRLKLREKGAHNGAYPHQLIMSATPIPRTLAQSLYADLDVSVIDELPPGRTPVETVAIPESRRDEVVARVHAACRAGRQAYWVCPLIQESEELDAQAAEETFASLKETWPDLKVALVHGRLKAAEKEKVMAAFKDGRAHVLVATTVIEVGVDVPNASLMIIENAERLGLSQLHQLRGRVGRGAQESHCVLLYRPPLSDMARARLTVLRETNDGFEIARRDMEMRGPGELLGTRQAGLPQFHIADLMRDSALLPRVQALAEQLLRENSPAAPAIVRRWLPQAQEFGRV